MSHKTDIIFYDFEVFVQDWLVVLHSTLNNETYVITNDPADLRVFFDQHVGDIWVGYNSGHYDQYVLKAILCGFDPYEMNDWIINKELPGWQFSDLIGRVRFFDFDVMQRTDRGLKYFEGSMGNSIKESSVSFKTPRKLTEAEIEDVVKYCNHDVEQLIEVFKIRREDFISLCNLIITFRLPKSSIGRTKAQLSAQILKAKKTDFGDEFDISLPPTMDISPKYQCVADWFMDPANHSYKDEKGHKRKLKIDIAGVPCVFAYGGVHGALLNYHEKGIFVNVDVESLYPSIMIAYAEYCFSRGVPKEGREKYVEIKDIRVALKKAGKKQEQAPYKIVLNSTYGVMKHENSALFDPCRANNVCVFGQILVGVDLAEKLANVGKIIQINTDGILLKLNSREDFDAVDDVCYEWEQRTGLSLDFDWYGRGEIYQKDVSNYCIIGEDGHYKTKGTYLKTRGDLDYDCPIIQEALIENMVHHVPIAKTINDCTDLRKFQIIKKIGKMYDYMQHNDRKLDERTVRVFADKKGSGGILYKKNHEKTKLDKVAGTPENCRIINENVLTTPTGDWLDRNYYIAEAQKRKETFG